MGGGGEVSELIADGSGGEVSAIGGVRTIGVADAATEALTGAGVTRRGCVAAALGGSGSGTGGSGLLTGALSGIRLSSPSSTSTICLELLQNNSRTWWSIMPRQHTSSTDSNTIPALTLPLVAACPCTATTLTSLAWLSLCLDCSKVKPHSSATILTNSTQVRCCAVRCEVL